MGKKNNFYVDVMTLGEEVTGSCHPCVVKFPSGERVKFVIDCGLFQESEYTLYNSTFPCKIFNDVIAVGITHAHGDHIGRLPLATREGYNAPIYTTKFTSLLMPFGLKNSAKLVQDEFHRIKNRLKKLKKLKEEITSEEWENKSKNAQLEDTLMLEKLKNTSLDEKIYFEYKDVDKVIELTKPCEYNKEIKIHEHITFTFLYNGHIPGAAMILVTISYPNEENINLLFTGDYATESTFVKDLELPKYLWDLPITVIQESTYATTDSSTIEKVFEKNLFKAMLENKTLLVPVFALDRSQKILLYLKKLQEKGILDLSIPIYLDGTLAKDYTNVYLKNTKYFKSEAKDFLPKNLTMVSKKNRNAINNSKHRKIILTTSGMGTFGPAPFYISNLITSDKAVIHFTGYPAEGTLSRRLKDAKKGEEVEVAGTLKEKYCDIYYTSEFSSHIKGNEMIKFLERFNDLRFLLINHGNTESKEYLAEEAKKFNLAKNIAVESREYYYRIGHYGLIKDNRSGFNIVNNLIKTA